MPIPTLNDYVSLMSTLFDEFKQYQGRTNGTTFGLACTYSNKRLLVFLTMMQLHWIYPFKSQHH